MGSRVVVTGLGVVAPNGVGIPAFLAALKNGSSGVKYMPKYQELNFNCQVCGMPEFELSDLESYLSEVALYGLRGSTIGYAVKAAADAWLDAGNTLNNEELLWETGCVFGNSVADTEAMKRIIEFVDAKQARKLGSRIVEQLMNSGATAYISGLLGLGNRVITNSAACATGSQAVLMGYEYIKHGTTTRMVVGSNEYVDPYIFGAFDSMRILARKFNHAPQQASRPMSATAGGFVPGSGAGALVLEDLEFALSRNANIYAEVLGGETNSGGQRGGGTMTSPNPEGVVSCIKNALKNAGVEGKDIDLISGHLPATAADKMEIENWAASLNRYGDDFPLTNSVKSMIGHCLSAAGSIEIVALILQIMHKFVHPNINLEDPNPEIAKIVSLERLPTKCISKDIKIAAKANFGFGDVNTCLVFSKYEKNG
ncbi:MAG TPA: beta-ketoacyl-[acyl-carrier-protein] synthase family protein [Puia sp.]|nr:beta-ketoacyl-[acyl-carrier-protein] synthase family protein [Puia sp.]